MAETDKAAALRRRMEAAAAAMDFEEAGRLRDQLSLMRAVADEDFVAGDTAGLERQRPGAMGLGSSRQQVTPPSGWTPPPKPDPMTRGRAGTRGGRR